MMAAQPSRERLFEDAIQSIARQIDDARARHAVESAEGARQRSLRERAQDRIKEGARRLPLVGDIVPEKARPVAARLPALDLYLARAEGQRRLQMGATLPEEDELAAIAVAICDEWRKPRAGKLATAWFNGRDVDVERLMNTDERTIAILVGIAAAAAVLAVVFFVRRGRTARVSPRHELAPSSDFQALISVAAGEGDAAAIAARLLSEIAEPWSWRLTDGLRGLSPADQRSLLSALAAQDLCAVSPFAPKAGDDFDSSRMSPSASLNTDDLWIVASNTPEDRRGYHVADRVEVLAAVEVCTADWWVLSRAGCTVGEAIIERADNLIAGGRAKAASWRAPWGFTFPEDLRGLPETVLDGWRQRLISELNPRYRDRPERQLVLVGSPGEPFESSMETEDGRSPVGDTVVSEVVLRDGVPQYGLACPGGSPLLLAVVRTRPARSGT